MELTEFAFRLVLLLLPGVLCTLIVDELTVHTPWSEFRFAVYSFLNGVISYVLMTVFISALNELFGWICNFNPFVLSIWSALQHSDAAINWGEVALAVPFALIAAALLCVAINRKWLSKAASRWGLSEKFGDESLYDFFLNSPDVNWVNVRCFDKNVMYSGWRESFSDQGELREVLLRDVRVFLISTGEFLYASDAVFLTLSRTDTVIEVAARD